MAKKKQSADEIVDSMAEEMGVKDEKPDESTDDLASDLGGIFGVSSKKKKKKKKQPEPEPVAEEEESEVEDDEEEVADEESESEVEEDESEAEEEESEAEDEEEEEEPAPKKSASASKKKSSTKKKSPEADKPKKKEKKHDLDGVFATGKSSDEDVDYSSSSSSYLDEDDLGGAVPGGGNTALIGVIVVLVVVLVGVVLAVTPIGKDLKLLFTGDLNATRDAEVRAIEDKFNAAQKAALAKYGNLNIQGNPIYATITLNGEQHYGQTQRGVWREVQLQPGFSNFSNLRTKDKHVIQVSAPAHDPITFELTEGKWNNNGGAFSYSYTANLLPKSEWDQKEFEARLSSDTENEYFGSVTLNSVPAGATIMFNNKPLLDKDGNALKTPATFTANYVKDEKTGKLEEVPVKVDTVLDQGHKVEMYMEGNDLMPRYGLQLQRQLWVCNKKAEDEITKLARAKDHTIQKECDYTFNKTVDFNAIKAYGERREKEKKRIEDYNARVKDIQARLANKEPVTEDEIKQLQEER